MNLKIGKPRHIVRTIVKDVFNIFKNQKTGEYYLPEYFNDEKHFYEFNSLAATFNVELLINQNVDIDDFYLDGEYDIEDETMIIQISYNPNNCEKIYYNLIGELNELVRHELQHIILDINNIKLKKSKNKNYYLQEEELICQYYGFKRMSFITKTSINDCLEYWFSKYKFRHKLSDKNIKKIIDAILKLHHENY
jgi:hypothetical protein